MTLDETTREFLSKVHTVERGKKYWEVWALGISIVIVYGAKSVRTMQSGPSEKACIEQTRRVSKAVSGSIMVRVEIGILDELEGPLNCGLDGGDGKHLRVNWWKT